jgi:hypothetical protein
MIERAQLGGARGAATVWIRKSAEGTDHRGSFWFRVEHDEEVQRLAKARAQVELVGWVGGERKRLLTRIVAAEPGTGLAIFEGSGELMLAEEPGRGVETGIVKAPAELGVCHLGSKLIAVSKERQPSGWLIWGRYACCGMILVDGLQHEPTAVLVGERRYDLAAG